MRDLSPHKKEFRLSALAMEVASDPKHYANEIATLRHQLQQAEARVAELEATLYHGNLEREKSQKVMILRKQAEAVDASGSLFARWGGSIITAWHGCAILEQEAKRLRQQAGELEAEKAGGEQCR